MSEITFDLQSNVHEIKVRTRLQFDAPVVLCLVHHETKPTNCQLCVGPFVFEAQVSGDHLLYEDILEGFWSRTNAWIKQERWITDVYPSEWT